MNYSVVMPCAGVGSRMGLGYNKLLYKMKNGKCVLENTLTIFLNDPRCQQIILAIGKDDYQTIESFVKDQRIELVLGGATRQESVYHGLLKVTSEYVMVHDGARPFLKKESIDALLKCLETKNACLLMVKAKDTIKVVKDGKVIETPNRETLWNAQTPQAFKTEIFMAANIKAKQCGFIGTDDTSIVEAMLDEEVSVVEGDYENIKITTPEDLLNDR